MKPQCFFYLLALSLELEAAAVEICTLFPRSFACLNEERRRKAHELYSAKKKARLNQIALISKDSGVKPDIGSICRELIQTTMFCDKETMLLESKLGLTSSKKKIQRVFNSFQRVRDYVAHPCATFTWDEDAADMLNEANHEAVYADGTAPILFSQSPSRELLIEQLSDVAKKVQECEELIADIDAAILHQRKCPPA